MTARTSRQAAATRTAIKKLFHLPPASEAEFEQRAAEIDPAAGRSVLLDLLRAGKVDEDDANLFIALAERVDLARAEKKLLQLVESDDAGSSARFLALNALLHQDPAILERSGLELDQEMMMKLMDMSNRRMLAYVLAEPGGSAEITQFLLRAPTGQDDLPFEMLAMFEMFESCRQRSAVPAAFTYRDALRCSELMPLHSRMLSAIVAEGGMASTRTLEDLMAHPPGPDSRREAQEALMRLRTRGLQANRFPGGAIEEGSGKQPVGSQAASEEDHTLEAEAFLSSCDGQGAFVLLIKAKLDGSHVSMADLCIRTAAEVRDGFILPRTTQEEFEELRDVLRAGGGSHLVRVPLSHAASVISEAAERTLAAGLSVPEKLERALHYAEWLSGLAREEPGFDFSGEETFPAPATSVLLDDFEDMLEDPVFESWFFDAGDLLGVGIDASEYESVEIDIEKWLEDCIARLDTEPIRTRLSAMTRHMAWCYTWSGDTAGASQCAAAVQAIEREFRQCDLVWVMLERSLEMAMLGELFDDSPRRRSIGDPQVRQQLQVECFPRLRHPKGKHLAILDLTEAALETLGDVINDLPGELRPPERTWTKLAFTMGKACAETALEGRRPGDVAANGPRFKRLLNGIKRHGRLDERTSVALWHRVAIELEDFVDTICGQCPVRCLDHPTANMSAVFFSPLHPAQPDE